MQTGRPPATIYYESPIGPLAIVGVAGGILEVRFVAHAGADDPVVPHRLHEAARQLDAYFRGNRRRFDLALLPQGTRFQQQVWRHLEKIPFGRVSSYGAVARAVGRPRAARAVGGANHRNPIAIVIPCHRVVGHNGNLVGYGGGLWRKRWLLQHEGLDPANLAPAQSA
jgi:methylated-DNA-[protein]-cysteine S-methyltransferase